MKFWFLSYLIRHKKPSVDSFPYPSQIILAGIHPLIWLCTPSDMARQYNVSLAISFHEIDEDTFNEVRRLNYMECYDVRQR